MCSYSNRMLAAPYRDPLLTWPRAKPSITAFVGLTNGALYWTVVGCVHAGKFVSSSPNRSRVLKSVTMLRLPFSHIITHDCFELLKRRVAFQREIRRDTLGNSISINVARSSKVLSTSIAACLPHRVGSHSPVKTYPEILYSSELDLFN